MAKVAPSYVPGWKGTLTIDTVAVGMMGWKADDSVDSLDVTLNTDNGFSKTEAGIRTIKPTFTIPIAASATSSPVDVGGIYPMVFTINGVKKYEGAFTVLSANVNADVKGVASIDVVCQNHGDVTPVVTP